MAAAGTPTGKTLTDVVEQLETLNAELDQQGSDSRRSGAQLVKGGKIGRIFAFFHRRGAKKRDVQRGKEITALRHATMEEYKLEDQRHDDMEFNTRRTGTEVESATEAIEGSIEAIQEMSENQDSQLGNIEEALAAGSLATDIARETSELGGDTGGDNWAIEQGGFLQNIRSDTDSIGNKLVETNGQMDKTVDLLANILNLQIDDSAAAAEAAREAARAGGAGEKKVPDSKAEEAKAGGFFSKMGKAVMNPVGAMGRGMKSMGKGISGFLKGLSSGLASFANPLVLAGVAVLSISLPIFAAGLAAAFKVFEMIAGEGNALKLITGIIESLGEAIGTILHKVLSGFGEMVKRMGPFITAFFDGLATVVKALTPIVTALFKLIKDIITDPVLNKTMQAVIAAIQSAITDVKDVLVAFAPVVKSIISDISAVIIAVAGKIEAIVATVGSVIEKILASFDGVVAQIKPIIEQIGLTIETIINAIGDNIGKIGKTIEGIITSIGDNVTKVVGSISALITAIGTTISGVIDSVVGGIERLAALSGGNMVAVGAGLAAIGAGLVVFTAGAAVAGGVMPSPAELETVAKSIEKFGAIPSENLIKVGDGMTKVGVGLLAFGAGGALASLLNNPEGLKGVATSVEKFGTIDGSNFAMVGDGITSLGKGLATFGAGGLLAGISEGIGKFFGATDPVDKFQRFAKIGPGLKDASEGIKGLATAMNILGKSNIEKTAEAIDDFMDEIDMGKLTAFSKATEGLMTGQMLADLQVQSNQAGGGTVTTVINNTNSSQVNASQPVVIPASGVSPSNTDIMNVRIVG